MEKTSYRHMKELLVTLIQHLILLVWVTITKVNPMFLFDTINKHLNPPQSAVTPVSANNWEKCFFTCKINNIRSHPVCASSTTPSLLPSSVVWGQSTSPTHLLDIVSHMHTSPCHLPLASLYCQSVPGCVPDYFKTVSVFPLLKNLLRSHSFKQF